MKTDGCPSCKERSYCPGFQKVFDAPDEGYVLYRHTTRIEDINKKTGTETITDTIDDVFIIEKTQGDPLGKIDFASQIDPERLKCPRCAHLIKNAQKLFQHQELENSNVIGVCGRCKQRLQSKKPCAKCEDVVKEFRYNRRAEKQTQVKRIKDWLLKVQQLIKLALSDGANRKADSKLIRRHSEVDINNLLKEARSGRDREPDIEDLFSFRGYTANKKRSKSLREFYQNRDNNSFLAKGFDDKQFHPMFKMPYDLESLRSRRVAKDFLMRSSQTLTEDEIETEFIRKYGRSYRSQKEAISKADLKWFHDEEMMDFVPIPDLRHRDEMRKVREDGKGRDSTEALHDLDQERDLRYKENKWKEFQKLRDDAYGVEKVKHNVSEIDMSLKGQRKKEPIDALAKDDREDINKQLPTELSRLDRKLTEGEKKIKKRPALETEVIYESPSRMKYYRSKESLLIGLEDTFDYVFPGRTDVAKKNSRLAESAELIKETLDMLKARKEEERKKREEAEMLKEEQRKKLELVRRAAERSRHEKIANLGKQSGDLDKDNDLGISQKKTFNDKVSSDGSAKTEKSKKIKSDSKNIDSDITKGDKSNDKKIQDKKEKDKAYKTEKGKLKNVIDDKEKDKNDKAKGKNVKDENDKEDKLSEKRTDGKFQGQDRKGLDTKGKDKKGIDDKDKKGKDDKVKGKKEKDEKEKGVDGKFGGQDLQGRDTKYKDKKGISDKDKKEAKEGKFKDQDTKSKDEKGKDGKTRIEKGKDGKGKKENAKPGKADKVALGNESIIKTNREAETNEGTAEDKEKEKQLLEAAERRLREEEKRDNKMEEEYRKLTRSKTKIKMMKPYIFDLIANHTKTEKQRPVNIPTIEEIQKLKSHKLSKTSRTNLCTDSDVEVDDMNKIYEKEKEEEETKRYKINEAIVGDKIYKFKVNLGDKEMKEPDAPDAPLFFHREFGDNIDIAPHLAEVADKTKAPTKGGEDQSYKGVVRYFLSDRQFIDKGWTKLPTEKVVRKMNVYRMRPSHPEFDWFEHNKKRGVLEYDSGERLAEFDESGRCRVYYRSGKLALDYYNAEELNAQQRFVIYSSGEPDERGRSRPRTVLATFDYLGNGIVFDHAGKIRLKYNQTEGVVLDRSLGPVSHWKWHTLNDPPVLQQVMLDTQLSHKDPKIQKLGSHDENIQRTDDETMLAIEFDNFIKEKSAKLSQTFKPFQIKMKALKINENFSLKVLDQATVYLIYRDGSTTIKYNIGMILDHKEIVDTDTAEVGEVCNTAERLPAKTDSLVELQRNIANAQKVERLRVDRDRRIRRPEAVASADRLTAAASRPRPPLLTRVESASTGVSRFRKCGKSHNVYYDTSIV